MLACWSFRLIAPCETDGTGWTEMLTLKWHLLVDKDLLKSFICDAGTQTTDWNLCGLPQPQNSSESFYFFRLKQQRNPMEWLIFKWIQTCNRPYRGYWKSAGENWYDLIMTHTGLCQELTKVTAAVNNSSITKGFYLIICFKCLS